MPIFQPTPTEYLTTQIAAGRRRMQTLWDAKGCSDAEVLAASIELDLLLNEYHRQSQRSKVESQMSGNERG